MRLILSISILLLVAACGQPIGSDQAELRNIKPYNRVPKSSPTQFVKAFDRFCLSPVNGLETRESRLRKASYVPTQTGELKVFLVDDRRPAIVLGKHICSARALSRTGQTEKLQVYIASNFPNARPLDPSAFGHDVEQAWRISSPIPAFIATERTLTIDGYTGYAVTIFRPNRIAVK